MTNTCLTLVLAASACLPLLAAPTIELGHKVPCNLFATGEPVRVSASLSGVPAGEHVLRASVTNYFGETVWEREVPLTVEAGKKAVASLDLGGLEPGYYDLLCRVGNTTASCSLGVATLASRSVEEALAGGYRFGLKVFQVGHPGVWWRRPLEWKLAEAVDASVALGFNWTRHGFNQHPSEDQSGIVGTVELTTRHSMNVVYKIEGMPEEAYDAGRYGPIEAYKAKKKKGWSRTTVPLKEPYQAWLREQLSTLPASQNVFEIGNEVWDYMSMTEFAEWCRLVVPVVKELRPGAVVGADPGSIARAKEFIRAGGMEGMNAEFIHPYSFTPLPEHRVRAWLRNRSDFLARQLGRRLDIYVTEYGWSTAPRDKRKQAVSERTQAQRTARQSLMLYAEDCKTLIPHWMADREEDPTNWDHWFGFFRLNGEPKPVVIAHAVCARMIDGSRFIGDLWLGSGVGAMLFDRGGTRVLALWTLDEQPGSGRDLTLDAAAAEVRVIDIMGRARTARTDGGRLSLKVSGDVTYVEGVGETLVAQAVPPSADLHPERWAQRAADGGAIVRAQVPHVADGLLTEWEGVAPMILKPVGADAAADVEARGFLAWDDTYLHVAVRVVGAPATEGGAFELLLGTRPSRQLNLGGWGIYDYALTLAPTSKEGTPTLQLSNCTWDAVLANPAADDPTGVLWAVVPTKDGWTAEAAIPRRTLAGFPDATGPKALTGIFQWRTGKARLANSTADPAVTRQWPFLELCD